VWAIWISNLLAAVTAFGFRGRLRLRGTRLLPSIDPQRASNSSRSDLRFLELYSEGRCALHLTVSATLSTTCANHSSRTCKGKPDKWQSIRREPASAPPTSPISQLHNQWEDGLKNRRLSVSIRPEVPSTGYSAEGSRVRVGMRRVLS